MISIGTMYALSVLGMSAALYLALRVWLGQKRWTAGGLAVLVFGLLVGALLNTHRITWLDAGVALSGGVLGRWIFEPPHPSDRHARTPHADPMASASLMEQHPAIAAERTGRSPGGSLTLVVHQLERRTDLAVQEANALDNKAGFVLGAASFVLLGVTGLQGVAASHRMERDIVHVVQWLAVGSVLIYLGVVSAALIAYVVHAPVVAPEPVAFQETYRSAPEEETQVFLIQALLCSFAANHKIVEKKTRWTRRALRAFLAETVFLALILIAIAVTL